MAELYMMSLVSTNCYELAVKVSNTFKIIVIYGIDYTIKNLTCIRPLFPGSSQADQIFKVCSVLGTPTQRTWMSGLQIADSQGFKFPTCTSTNFTTIVPKASQKAVELISRVLQWNPDDRPCAEVCLQHNWFEQLTKPQQSKLSSYRTQSHHKSTRKMNYPHILENDGDSKKNLTKAETKLAALLRTPPKTKLPDDLDSLLKLE